MKTTSLPSSLRTQGYSLVEALMFIAILGILCGIAIPNLLPDNKFAEARDRRNAQELASFCMTAEAAGLSFVVPGDLEKTVANILKGGSPEKGVFKGRLFVIRSIAEQDAKAASKYLRLNGNALLFLSKDSNDHTADSSAPDQKSPLS